MNTQALIPLIAFLGLIVILMMVARQSLRRRTNLLFIWYVFLLAGWAFASFMIYANFPFMDPLFWNSMVHLFIASAPVAFFHFVRVFLRKSEPRFWLSLGYIVAALYTIAAALGYTIEYAYWEGGVYYFKLGTFAYVISTVAFFFAAAAIINLVQAYRGARDPFNRNRIFYPLVGACTMAVLAVTNFLPGWKWYPVDQAGNLINAILLAYAILRYRLVDISIVFRRGFLYSGLTVSIVAVFLIVAILFFTAFRVTIGPSFWFSAVIMAIIVAAVFMPLQRTFQRWIDRLFYREAYDYRQTLRTSSQKMSTMLDLEELAEWLVSNLVMTMRSSKGGLFLLDRETQRYVPRALKGYNPGAGSIQLKSDNPVVKRLAKGNSCLTVEDIDRLPQLRSLWKSERGELKQLEAEVLVPLKAKDELIGLLLLGPKLSEEPYTIDDMELLLTVAHQAVVALENARLYEESLIRAEKLRESQEMFRGMLESAAAGMSLIQEGRFQYVSPLFEEITGYRSDELIGTYSLEYIHPEDRETTRKKAIENLKGENTLPHEFRFVRKGGETVWILEKFASIEYGGKRAAIASFMDITERKKAEEELNRAYQELKTAQDYVVQSERLRALGEMAGGVAHDFNNVLAVILGRAQLALEDVNDDKVRRGLQIIEQSALDASTTVRRLQDFARVRVDRDFEAVNLNQLVEGALQMVESRRVEREEVGGVTIDISAEMNKVPPVNGNSAELREALLNIIFNAMDAMPEGGKITIKSEQKNSWVVLSISDTGVGISEEVIGKIFEPFFTTRTSVGSGLGLSVTYGIITRHDGRIDVESTPGKGTTFYIRLPVARGVKEKSRPERKTPIIKPATILLVDDDPEVSEVLELMLEQLGHHVTGVTSGEQALSAFEKDDYDLVITDLGMPDISGREVAKAIREMKPETPVILITGWGVQLNLKELPEIDGVIAKPFSKEALSAQVAELLTTNEGSAGSEDES